MIWCLATSGEGFVASPSLSRTQQPPRSRRGFARGFSDLRTSRFGVGEIATGLRSNRKKNCWSPEDVNNVDRRLWMDALSCTEYVCL
jgi:hypothetical protein